MCRECSQHPDLALECRRLRSETLRRVYLFEDVPAERLAPFLDRMVELELAPERFLCFRGDPACRFFLVLEGDLALVRQSADGDELIVAILGPGELLGEDLALAEDPRHAVSARAIGPCHLASFDLAELRRLSEDEPDLVRKLARTVQRRNAILLEELERVTVQDAAERLIRFLESPEATDGGALRFPKRVLASRLSMRPETLSRVLARLKGCHRIREVDGALVVVRDGSDAACSGCEACPALLWGCPGPGRARPSAPVRIAASAASSPRARSRSR